MEITIHIPGSMPHIKLILKPVGKGQRPLQYLGPRKRSSAYVEVMRLMIPVSEERQKTLPSPGPRTLGQKGRIKDPCLERR